MSGTFATYEAVGLGGGMIWWCAMMDEPSSPLLDAGVWARLGPAGAGTFTRRRSPVGILRRVDGGFVFATPPRSKVPREVQFRSLAVVDPVQLRGTGWPGALVGRPQIREETVQLTVVCSPEEASRWRAGTAALPGGFSACVRQMMNERFP